MDLAEHWFLKISAQGTEFSPAFANQLVNTLAEFGNDELGKAKPAALLWLERAQEILAHRNMKSPASDARKLKKHVLHGLDERYHRASPSVQLLAARSVIPKVVDSS